MKFKTCSPNRKPDSVLARDIHRVKSEIKSHLTKAHYFPLTQRLHNKRAANGKPVAGRWYAGSEGRITYTEINARLVSGRYSKTNCDLECIMKFDLSFLFYRPFFFYFCRGSFFCSFYSFSVAVHTSRFPMQIQFRFSLRMITFFLTLLI